MRRALLSSLLFIACGPPAQGPETPASGIAEPIRPIEREGLPLRCDDDAVDALRNELLAPGGSPRVQVAFRPGNAKAAYSVTQSFDGRSAETELEVAAADKEIQIAAGEAYAVLAFAARSVSMTDGRSDLKRNRAAEVVRDLFGLGERGSVELLPAAPIGAGARWRTVARDEYGFLAADYRALEIGPDSIKLAVQRLECRKMLPISASPEGNPECDDPAAPPADPLECFQGTEKSRRIDRGELTLSLASPIPVGTIAASEEWVSLANGVRKPGNGERSTTVTLKR